MRNLTLTLVLLFVAVPSLADDSMKFEWVHNGGNCIGCEWVSAQGTITADTHKDFLKFAQEEGVGKYTFVVLNSPGGNLVGGLNLGRVFRSKGVVTRVGKTVKEGEWHKRLPGGCHSACSYAFLGGYKRLVSKGSELGLHQFYYPIALEDMSLEQFTGAQLSNDQKQAAQLFEYVASMGVDPNFVLIASKTDPKDLYVLSEEEIASLHVDNYFDRYTPWELIAFSGGLIAEIKNTQDTRRIRLYCNQDGIYLTYLLFEDLATSKDYLEPFKELVNRIGLIVVKDQKETPIKTLNRQVVKAKNENRDFLAVILQIDKKTHEILTNASIIDTDRSTYARASATLGEMFGARITGDSRLPKLALKACIK